MEIIFYNELGEIIIAGGPSPLLCPTEISGLFMPERETTTAVFKTQPGQKLISERDKERTIKITGTVEGNLPRAAKLFHLSGTLIFKTERMTRVISARCVDITNYTNNNKIVLSFVCDNPYFNDGTDLNVTVYSKIKQITNTFTLPAIFTKRIRKGNCKNESTVITEPEISIFNRGKNSVTGFTLTNESTSVSLTVNCEIPPESAVFISIPNRTIKSADGENLLPFLAENCYLHDFVLVPDDNIISLEAEDGVECEVIYNTNYTEAVI